MLAIVGLGNPGDRYANTRHNVGFDVIDRVAQRTGIVIQKLKCRAMVGEGQYNGEKLMLLKPQTFMNESGLSVSDAMSFYKLSPAEVLVLVDDIDLPFGQVRLRAHGGPGTHNGLRSIVQCLGNGDFPRVRVGVGAPPPEWDLADYVLGRYQTKDDIDTARQSYDRAAEAALCWASLGIEKAMNQYNVKTC